MLLSAVVRDARAEDAADVVALLQRAGLEVAFDPREFKVAEQDGGVVACGRLKPVGDELELASVAVHEELRGTGIGATLVRALLDAADRRVVALALAPGFFERVGLRRLDAVPPSLQAKARGFCASARFVPMARDAPADAARDAIRARYAAIALGEGGGPQLHLGTGSPLEAARLRPGETVVDLGSGAGADVIPAARLVGPTGRAIGIDFTPEMIARARRHAAESGVPNATFEEGVLEALPLPDGVADVVVSNCVINLSTDKPAALREAHRVLKQGGRLAISDTLRLAGDAPSAAPSCDCVSGALSEGEWGALLKRAGFVDVRLAPEAPGGCCTGPTTGRVMVTARKA